jgi:hypothetical protein
MLVTSNLAVILVCLVHPAWLDLKVVLQISSVNLHLYHSDHTEELSRQTTDMYASYIHLLA